MNKTAIIIGATSGIGAAFARRLASEGYDLIITGRRKNIIQKTAKELSDKFKIKIRVIIAELSDDKDLKALMTYIKSIKSIDILINNAGFGTFDNFHESNIAINEKMLKVHALAPMKIIHTVIPKMIAKGSGTIINVSSAGAFVPLRKNSIYGGTKSFLNIFTESLYMELIDKGIKFQALCPGFTRTDFHKRLDMKKEEKERLERFKWMSADSVVDYSLNFLKKNRVVCIPSIRLRMLIMLANIIPRRFYYRFLI